MTMARARAAARAKERVTMARAKEMAIVEKARAIVEKARAMMEKARAIVEKARAIVEKEKEKVTAVPSEKAEPSTTAASVFVLAVTWRIASISTKTSPRSISTTR